MRVLAVDLGFRRIGIAVGETEFSVATPRPSIAAVGKLTSDAEQVFQSYRKEQAQALVLGVPGYDDDRMEKVCRQFGAILEGRGLTVHYVDESFTSIAAEANLMASGLTAAGRKRKRDGEAACQILQRFFFEAQNP